MWTALGYLYVFLMFIPWIFFIFIALIGKFAEYCADGLAEPLGYIENKRSLKNG